MSWVCGIVAHRMRGCVLGTRVHVRTIHHMHAFGCLDHADRSISFGAHGLTLRCAAVKSPFFLRSRQIQSVGNTLSTGRDCALRRGAARLGVVRISAFPILRPRTALETFCHGRETPLVKSRGKIQLERLLVKMYADNTYSIVTIIKTG